MGVGVGDTVGAGDEVASRDGDGDGIGVGSAVGEDVGVGVPVGEGCGVPVQLKVTERDSRPSRIGMNLTTGPPLKPVVLLF